MSKILANQIANYGDDAPIEIKEGLNIPAGKPIQAAGVSGTSGQVLTSTGVSIEWTDNFSGSYTDLTNKPTIPAAQVRANWNAVGTVSEILNKPIVPAVPSVTVNPPGTANLTYTSLNGEFTYTPPDLSSYLTSYTETDPVFAASDAAAVTAAKITNWDTAYGWGNHASAGYLTSLAVENLSNVDITAGLSDQQVLKWDAASSSWKPANDLVGGAQGIQFVDLSVSTAPAGSPSLSYNNTNGVFTYTPPDLSGYATTAAVANAANWDTAYGWGDHAAEGYLTAYTETDPVFSASPAAGITLTKINQWDTAYGWGNHANGGYLTTETDPLFSASVAAGISGAEVANWNTAYGWGDHSVESYLTSTGSIDTHTDVTITTPVNGEVLAYSGGQWVNTNAASIANATISDTAPGSPVAGDLWWESDKGRLKIYYNDTDSQQWVDASPPLAQPNVPVAAGCITLNGTSPTWSGTAGYTVSGAQPGGAGTDYVITLTFPTAYSARTDYIVQATYDSTNYVSGNGASIGVARGTASVVFTPRRWDENPLSLGEIMVTITNL